MKRLLLVLLCANVMGCAPLVESYFNVSLQSLPEDASVAILDQKYDLPQRVRKIGHANYGDTGLSAGCSLEKNMVRAQKLARKKGANIIKITETRAPNFSSNCYRVAVDFYYFEGDVTRLPQYHLSQ